MEGTPPDKPPAPPAPPGSSSPSDRTGLVFERFGSYVIIRPLASGGMAEVMLARRLGVQGFERLVVIKRVLPELARDARFVSMFLDEAYLAAQLDHPNIVQIQDLGEANGRYFLAMEYLRGQSVATLLARLAHRGSTLPPSYWCSVMDRVLSGLHFAHEARGSDGRALGIVHRDVSPHNIMITYHGEVKIIDFGVALGEQRLATTQAGTIKGKLAYLAPEQVLGLPVDCRADVFQAGIMMWELLTSRRLFLGDTELDTLKRVTELPLARPREIDPSIPEAVDAVVMRALERDLDRRYQTAAEMREDLRAFLRPAGLSLENDQLGAVVQDLCRAERDEDERLLRSAFAEYVPSGIVVLMSEGGTEVRLGGVASAAGVIGLIPPSAATASLATPASGPEPQGEAPAVLPASPPEPSPRAAPLRDGAAPDPAAGARAPSAPPATGNLTGGSARAAGTTPPPLPPAAAVERALVPTEPPALAASERRVRTRRRWTGAALLLGVAALVVVSAAAAVTQLGGPATGALDVRSDPVGATITLDGIAVGTTPLILPRVRAGAHDVRLFLFGHEPATLSVVVPEGAMVPASVALKPLPTTGAMAVDTSPPGAMVELDGIVMGKTPALLERLETGTHALTLTLEGHEAEKRLVAVKIGDTTDVSVALKRLAAPATGAAGTATASAAPGSVARGWGKLTLDTEPYSDVYIGKRRLGFTPFTEVRVPAGKITLTLVNKAESIETHYPVVVPAGGSVVLRLKL